MTDLRAPYTDPIRSRWHDRSTGCGFGFLESPFNKSVARLAGVGSEHLRRALILALFPQLEEKGWRQGRVPHLEESGDGADFAAVDYSPAGERTELARTEHKPGNTPPQWNHAITTDDLLADPAVEVTAEQAAHIRRYQDILDKRWIDDTDFKEIGGYQCNGLKDRRNSPGTYESVWPQVIGYRLYPTPLEVVAVIADRSDDINTLYKTEAVWYRMKPEYFPIYTSADVLNILAREVDIHQLSADERADLSRVVDALWQSADKAITDQCDDAVRDLVSDAAWHVGYHWEEANWVSWKDWEARNGVA